LQLIVQVAFVQSTVELVHDVAVLQLITQTAPGGHVMLPPPVTGIVQVSPVQVPPAVMQVDATHAPAPESEPEAEPRASPVPEPVPPVPTASKPMRPHAATTMMPSHTRTRRR